jgi:aminopeptidase N
MITRIVLAFLVCSSTAFSQQLPTGTYRPNRERTYDLIHTAVDLQIDWKGKRISGEAALRIRPLGTLTSVSLDAIRMSVSSVREHPSNKQLKFTSTDWMLDIQLGRTLQSTDTITILISYSCTPTAGLYFTDPPTHNDSPTIFTYGEGGLLANWIPTYAAPNDKFSSEIAVRVAKPHVAVSNGKHIGTTEHPDDTRTFRWKQELPHSDYLLALFVGPYDSLQLRSAFGTIPLSVWFPRGRKEEAALVFKNTTEMVEFFSQRFNFRYPWDKYDQVAAYDYAIGAMENTSITGHNDRILRSANGIEEFNPGFESYASNWTGEAIISHELAHHWFGDNTTYRSLASLWLNESFATYSMMLWDEHRLGKEYLQFSTWLALQSYMSFVEKERMIRPLEYRYYDTRGEIYNEQHTYLKGGIVLNMLRWILGDEDFFKALGYFQNKHQFSSVESSDLKTAIEESTGRNVEWFFDQWVYGGGHPRYEVSYRYLSDRRKIALTVKQTQPLVKGQGFFKLPINIRIDTKGTTTNQTIWVEHEVDHFFFDVPEKPQMVSFDGKGVVVGEVLFEKSLDELVYQVRNDELPGKLWALRQLALRYGGFPATIEVIGSILKGSAPWWLKAEATAQLRDIQSDVAEELLLAQLSADDYHIRKSAVIALGSRLTRGAREALRRTIQEDRNTTVVGAALVALAKIDNSLSREFLQEIASRPSWYGELRVAALTAAKIIGHERFVPMIKEHVSERHNMAIRIEALNAWAACAPTDPQLIETLLASSRRGIAAVRQTAMSHLAALKIAKAIPILEELERNDGDGDIRKAAGNAVEEIRRLTNK